MTHVDLIEPNVATGDRGALLAEINDAFGTTPAMFRAAANSTAALRSMWDSFGALGNGVLPAQLTELIAVAIADRNRCAYCLAAHTALGRKAGISREQLTEAQAGRSEDPRTAAVLRFALAIVEERGAVPSDVVVAARDAGVSDEEIVEVIAHVALNLFTNYLNVALDVPVDFPSVELTAASA